MGDDDDDDDADDDGGGGGEGEGGGEDRRWGRAAAAHGILRLTQEEEKVYARGQRYEKRYMSSVTRCSRARRRT